MVLPMKDMTPDQRDFFYASMGELSELAQYYAEGATMGDLALNNVTTAFFVSLTTEELKGILNATTFINHT